MDAPNDTLIWTICHSRCDSLYLKEGDPCEDDYQTGLSHANTGLLVYPMEHELRLTTRGCVNAIKYVLTKDIYSSVV